MRYLILSDIHANLTALEASLAASAGKWEKVACLGDVVGYGPDPNEVVDRLRELGAVTIRGNHDKAGSGIANADDFNPVARSAAMWTLANLRPDNLTYLKELPVGPVQVDGMTLVHGAVRDEDEYVFAAAQALDGLLDSPSPVTFFGHTHIQGGFCLQNNRVEPVHPTPAEGKSYATLEIDPTAQYLLNPGSVGQPRDGDPRAGFAVADLEHKEVEFWRVAYDIEAVQKRMANVGLPEALILRLAFGR